MRNIVISILFLLPFCRDEYKLKIDNYWLEPYPAGTIRIDSNLFVDKLEVCNFYWLEYLFWTQRVFGKNSEEYQSMLPDTLMWREIRSYYVPYEELYFRHPKYRFYPVVGVTQEQARAFCKWRSDRVFEYCLIVFGEIHWNPNQTAENYFSIERYYKGEYLGVDGKTVQPHPDKFPFYPEYFLPSAQEWLKAKTVTDSLNRLNIKKCTNIKQCEVIIFDTDSFLTAINYNKNNCPTRDTLKNSNDSILLKCELDFLLGTRCVKNKDLVFYMLGNVKEWLAEENYCIGGSWLDSDTSVFLTPQLVEEPFADIGFRAFCRWKRYEKPSP